MGNGRSDFTVADVDGVFATLLASDPVLLLLLATDGLASFLS